MIGLPGVDPSGADAYQMPVKVRERLALNLGDPGEIEGASLSAAIITEGGTIFALKGEIPTGAVTSTTVSSIIVTADPAEVASAPPGALVLFSEPAGKNSDFLVGTSEVAPVWAGTLGNLSHVSGTILQHSGAASNQRYGFVLGIADGLYRNVDLVARVRYTALSTGRKCMLFARGTGTTGAENFIYTGLQTQAADSDAGGGLRLNAYVGGAIALTTPTAQIAKSDPWRNAVNTFYYLRLRVAADSVVASKQWIATDPEPMNWDLALAPSNVPAEFKSDGGSAYGWCGFMAENYVSPQDFDYFAVAFDGASAPLREDL